MSLRFSAKSGIVQTFLHRPSRSYVCFTCRYVTTKPQNRLSSLVTLSNPRLRKNFSSLNGRILQNQDTSQDSVEKDLAPSGSQSQRRKLARSPAANSSLRRVAVEAQRTRNGTLSKTELLEKGLGELKTVTAFAVAEQFNISKVKEILQEKGYECDPLNTGLYPQVVHIQVPVDSVRRMTNPNAANLNSDEVGDVFIFPSGTVVAWSLPDGFISYLASRTLLPAAEVPHTDNLETENMDFIEDSQRDSSCIKGETIILGTKLSDDSQPTAPNRQTVDTVLTKIAFSSGLARSTKLAVLESLLSDYFESTRNIPTLLSKGSRLPYTREFILQKTGQLLSVRAQLNLYSELTDSLPDIFWDSRHELGLEGYYEEVGRALDVGIRIKVLNERMDYAQDIANVLRERLSETHGLRLEWIIILLIAVEVGFEVLRLWKERDEERKDKDKRKVIAN